MSGEKDAQVMIRQSELNRIRKQCQRVEQIDTEIQEQVNRARAEMKQDTERRLNEMRQRLAGQRESMSAELRRVEAEQNRRILGLTGDIAEVRAELAAQGEQLRGEIQSVVRNIQRQEQDQREVADIWLADAAALLDEIAARQRPEKFRPGRLDALRQSLSMAQGNRDAAMWQTMAAGAQQVVLGGTDLRGELMIAEIEWLAALDTARQALVELQGYSAEQRQAAHIFHEEGAAEAAEPVTIDTDYWTSGQLSQVDEAARTIEVALAAADNLSTADLEAYRNRLALLRQEAEQLSEQAWNAFLASQIRQNIAASIVNSLSGSGWDVHDSTYTQEDYREGYHLRLTNHGGDEILTVITPSQTGNVFANNLSVHFFDPNSNEEKERVSRLNHIRQGLGQEGIECSPFTCRGSSEPAKDRSLLDLDRVRAQQPLPRQAVRHEARHG